MPVTEVPGPNGAGFAPGVGFFGSWGFLSSFSYLLKQLNFFTKKNSKNFTLKF